MNISNRIKEWRTYENLTQRGASSKIGVPYSSYQKYEMGPSTPGTDALEGFVRAGVNANWLLTGEGPMLLADLMKQGTSMPGLDHDRMRLAIESTREGLLAAKREMDPSKEAELILAVYDLLEEPNISKERVLKLVKLAA